MLKHIAEREAKDNKSIQKKRELEAKNKSDANYALKLQMKEKQAQKDLVRKNDAIYANQVQSKVIDIEQLEREAIQKKQQAKVEYKTSLNQQIKTEKQKKKYDILMTEHERRVHDKTIKAYEQFQLDDVNDVSGVPRIG